MIHQIFGMTICIMGGIALYIGIYHLIFSYRFKTNAKQIYFGFLSLSVAFFYIHTGLLYHSSDLLIKNYALRGQFFSTGLIVFLWVLFLFRLTHQVMPWLLRLIIGFWLGTACAVWFPMPWLILADERLIHQKIQNDSFYFIFIVSILLGLGIAYLKIHSSLIKQSQRRFLWPLRICFLIFAFDLLSRLEWISFPLATQGWAYLLIVVIVDQVLLRQFADHHLQQKLDAVLEERVEERTEEIQQQLSDLQAKNRLLKRTNERLELLSERDSLTGVYNRGAFQKRLESILNMAARHQIELGIGMIDVDWFKDFNDQYGHHAGDEVLLAVAGAIAGEVRDLEHSSRTVFSAHSNSELRNYDIIGRYGGDEFAIILPFCNRQKAEIVLTRMLRAVRSISLESVGNMKVSISIGLCLIEQSDESLPSEEILQRADTLLYKAKRQGRNRYILGEYNPVKT